jgi:hypothetical protein
MKTLVALMEMAHRAVDPRIVPFAILSGLILAAIALSAFNFLAVYRTRAVVGEIERRSKAGEERCEAIVESLRATQSALEAELREIREQPSIGVSPTSPKPGLNLSTRSQALRMHRRGDPPDRIAATLDIPLQEVDLLVKVHRIVISNI